MRVGAHAWVCIGARVAPVQAVIKHLLFFPSSADLEESTFMSDNKCAETMNLLNYKYAAADANEPKLENTDPCILLGEGGGADFLFRHLLFLKLPSN